MRGIFFSLSSLMAICNGSVSPSRSTSTGAFMLRFQSAHWPSTHPSQRVTDLICNALVPRMRAFSYLVIKGVVVRLSLGIFLSLCDLSLPLP